MRLALALACLLLATSAQAETNQERLRRWFRPASPTATQGAPPTAEKPVHAPSTPKHQTAPPAAPESPKVVPKFQPPKRADRSKPKPKPKVERPPLPLSGGGQALPPPVAGISCSEARKGVGMPCGLIIANAYRYERLSPAQKRQADNCLTAAERAAIKACFR